MVISGWSSNLKFFIWQYIDYIAFIFKLVRNYLYELKNNQ